MAVANHNCVFGSDVEYKNLLYKAYEQYVGPVTTNFKRMYLSSILAGWLNEDYLPFCTSTTWP